MDVFELNTKAPIRIETFMGTNIYYIDDFYRFPNLILKLLDTIPAKAHQPWRDLKFESNNGVYFEDNRQTTAFSEMEKVTSYLSKICGSPLWSDPSIFCMNKTRFYPNKFNDFQNNFWHPHSDPGYNALIYFNKGDSECGTNLYKEVLPDTENQHGEHVFPWRSKSKWEIVKTLEPKFNRCVLFDGGQFPHGMHITNERYFGNEYRLNQVVFFEKKQKQKE